LPWINGYSYLRVVTIWIDVHPAEETRPTRYVRFPHQSTYAWRTLPTDSPYTWQPFMSHRQIWTDPLPREKKGSRHNPQHTNWSICGSVPSFSHRTASEAVGKIQASVDDKLLDLLDPYHQHAISTFNSCSRGLTHRSLTNTGGGYNLEGVDFPHATHRPSQSAIFPFHLRAPHSLRLSINSLPCELKGDHTLNLTSGSLHSTSAVTCHLSTAWANDVPLR
jgi:hypothetical protein